MNKDNSKKNKSDKNSPSLKQTNMEYLKNISKNNSKMILEMINVYLEETPQLLDNLNTAIKEEDWTTIRAAAHAILPSFTMMGMDKVHEQNTQKILNHAHKKEKIESIQHLYSEINNACTLAFKELREEKAKIS